MVEDEDAAGPGHVHEKALGLRVVDPADLLVVPEILHRAALLLQRKALDVEPELVGDRAQRVDANLVRLGFGIVKILIVAVVACVLIGGTASALVWRSRSQSTPPSCAS